MTATAMCSVSADPATGRVVVGQQAMMDEAVTVSYEDDRVGRVRTSLAEIP